MKAALGNAAKDDPRPVSSLAQKIITDWLKAKRGTKMREVWRRGAILRVLGKEGFLHAVIGALLALLILGFFYWMGL